MNLYQINAEIMEAFNRAIDPETGEILDDAAMEEFNHLQFVFEAKIENNLLWIKNLNAEAKALKGEKQAFYEREKAATRKAESLKKCVAKALAGTKFETEKVKVSWRKSETVEYTGDVYKLPEEVLRYKLPEVDKAALKKLLKAGEKIEGAQIIENNNMSIR